MPSDSPQLPELSSSELLQSRNPREEGALESFVRSAVYSGIQNPINGVVQLYDRATGSNHLPSAQIIEPSRDNDLVSNAGTLTGTAAHLGLMLYAGHKIAGPGDSLAGFGRRVAVTGGLGAVYGGILTPVSNEHSFIEGRLRNAAVGGVGMAGLSAVTTVYKDLIGKGTEFLDAPHYHGLLVPVTQIAMPLIVDTQSRVYSPGSRRPLQDLLRPEVKERR